MKSQSIYQELKDLSEKLGISVMEQNLRKTGIKVKSGLCKIKGNKVLIIDKNLPLTKKNKILGDCLKNESHENIYILPAIRNFIGGK